MMQAGYAPTRLFHDRERAALRHRAVLVGWLLLIFVGAQFPVVTVDVIAAELLSHGQAGTLSEWFGSYSPVAAALYESVEYIVLVGLPLVIGLTFCRRCGAVPVTNRKVPATHAVALLSAGLAACVFANFAASLFAEFFSFIGVEPVSPPSSQNGTLPVLLLTLFSTAVLPAIMEELLFRGVILQLLRPAGDRIALILTSVLFGITHGTVEQIPFAFVVGLVCGYFVLKTGNIYLGMLLHFLNNAVAVVLDALLLNASTAESVAWTYAAFIVMALLGLIGWVFLRRCAPLVIAPVYDGRASWLSRGERRRAVWLTPTILIFMIVMVLMTLLATQADWLNELYDSLMSFGEYAYG